MTEKELAQSAYFYGLEAGFNLAMKELYKIREDEKNGNVTNCLHAYEWGLYLDRIMDRSIEEAKTKYMEIHNG